MPFSVGIQGQKKWRNPGHFLVVYSKPGVARHASKGRRNQRGGGSLILTDQVTLSQQGVKIMPTKLLPPLIFRPSYGPAVATVYRPLYVATDTVGQKGQETGRNVACCCFFKYCLFTSLNNEIFVAFLCKK